MFDFIVLFEAETPGIMKSIIILFALIIIPFTAADATPIKLQSSPQSLFRRADFQSYKTTKITFLNFLIDILSTMNKNVQNHDEISKGLSFPHLFITVFRKLFSAVRKDIVDPNNELQQIFFNFFNTVLSVAAKDIENQFGGGEAQFATGKEGVFEELYDKATHQALKSKKQSSYYAANRF